MNSRFLLVLLASAAALAAGRELRQTTTTRFVSSTGMSTSSGLSTVTQLPGSMSPTIQWPKLPTTTTLPSTPTGTTTTTLPSAAMTTTPASQTAPSLSGGYCPDPQRALDLHNAARAKRGAQPLSWSSDLAIGAQSWSTRCQFAHSQAPGLGENLYMSTSAAATCSDAVTMWLAEEPLYNGGYSSATGHYTQAVWKATTQLGCGLARCGTGVLVTCRYYQQGNVLGQFASNV